MLRIYIAHLLALFLSAAGIVAVEAALRLSIAHLSISRHYFVLKIEVSVIVGSRVSIHNYQMLCSTQAHEVGYTPTYISSSDWLIVEYHFVLRRDAKCERVLLRHILRPVRLLFLVERWRSTSIDEVTRKNVSNMKEMSAVDVVLSDGTECFLRFISIL